MPLCAPVAIRCVYTDLDGTLLGRGASLFRTAEVEFTLLAARALEACHRAGAEVDSDRDTSQLAREQERGGTITAGDVDDPRARPNAGQLR